MGNYENLKQSITEVIRTNGNQEITGAVLQNTLLTIISTVGANATFAGIATPTTNPGTPDGPVFWLASESGTYTNFGGIELRNGLSVLMWNDSWSSQQVFSIDDVPTAGSDNLVKSGGVDDKIKEIINIVGIQDITPNGQENANVITNTSIHLSNGNVSETKTINLSAGVKNVYIGGNKKVYDLTKLVFQVKDSSNNNISYNQIVYTGNINRFKEQNSLYYMVPVTIPSDGNYTFIIIKDGEEMDLRTIVTDSPISTAVKDGFIEQMLTVTKDYSVGLDWRNAYTDGSHGFHYYSDALSANFIEKGLFKLEWNNDNFLLRCRIDSGSYESVRSPYILDTTNTTNVSLTFEKNGGGSVSVKDYSQLSLSIKEIKTTTKECAYVLEDGAFNGSGNDAESDQQIRTNKIQCLPTDCIIAICPDNIRMYCNFENDINTVRSNTRSRITNGLSITNAKEFVRIGFERNDGSALNMSNLTEAERNGIQIYKIARTHVDADVVVAAQDSSNKNIADIICTSENVQYILNALTSCLGDISIHLLRGTYEMSHVFTTKYGVSCCLRTQEIYSKATTMVIKGDEGDSKPVIKMSQSCFEAMPIDSQSALLLVPCFNSDNISTINNPGETIYLNNIAVRLYNYTKPIVAIDLTFAGCSDITDCLVRGDYNYDTRVFDTAPNEDCIGIRVGCGSNNGINNRIKRTRSFYFGKGVSCSGEHFVFEDVLTHHCLIGWAFGDRKTGGHFEHPNVMIGCSIEGCKRLMLLTKMAETTEGEFVPEAGTANMYRSTLVCIGLSTEIRWDIPLDELIEGEPTYTRTLPILEILHGAYRGRIELDYSAIPFETNSGKFFYWTAYHNGVTKGHGTTIDSVLD